MAHDICRFCGEAMGALRATDGRYQFHPKCWDTILEVTTMAKIGDNAVLCPNCIRYIGPKEPRKSMHGMVYHEKCAPAPASTHIDDDKDAIEMPTSFTIEMIELSPNETEDAKAAMAEAEQLTKAMSIEPPLDGLHKDGWGWYQINGLVIKRRQILQKAFDTVFTADGGGDLFNPS